jgi:hypothetical protein
LSPVSAPPHDKRVKGPAGSSNRPTVIVIHTTQSLPRPGARDGIIDYLAGKKISVPWVTDDDGITRMTPLENLGDNHACGLDSKASGIEQIGMAQWGRKAWLNDHRETIRNTGKVVAYLLSERVGKKVTAENLKAHVIGHADDAKVGGCSTHWDPGPGYPYDVMFSDAIAYAASFEPPQDPAILAEATRGEIKEVKRFKRMKVALAYVKDRVRKGFRVVIRKRLVAGE